MSTFAQTIGLLQLQLFISNTIGVGLLLFVVLGIGLYRDLQEELRSFQWWRRYKLTYCLTIIKHYVEIAGVAIVGGIITSGLTILILWVWHPWR